MRQYLPLLIGVPVSNPNPQNVLDTCSLLKCPPRMERWWALKLYRSEGVLVEAHLFSIIIFQKSLAFVASWGNLKDMPMTAKGGRALPLPLSPDGGQRCKDSIMSSDAKNETAELSPSGEFINGEWRWNYSATGLCGLGSITDRGLGFSS